MKVKNIGVIFIFFLAQSVLLFAESDYVAKIIYLKGKAYYKQSANSNFKVAQLGDKLRGNYFFKTTDKSKAHLMTSKGTKIVLDKKTMIYINDVIPSKKKSKKAFGLCFGKIKLAVKKLKKGDQFEIMTPTAVAGVRGTKFSVETLADGSAFVKVNKGKVQVESGNNSVDVKKRENAGVNFSDGKMGKSLKASAFKKEKEKFAKENPGKVLEMMSKKAENLQSSVGQVTNGLDRSNYATKFDSYVKDKSSVVTMSALSDVLYNNNQDDKVVQKYYQKIKSIDERFNEISASIDEHFKKIDEKYEKAAKAIDEKSNKMDKLLDKKFNDIDKKLNSDQ